MAHLGIISLQSDTKKDVFYKGFVQTDDTLDVEGGIASVEGNGFNLMLPWVSGKKPLGIDVMIEGDGCRIYGWFKGTSFPGFFTINVYIEYEENEVVVEKDK